MNIINFLIPHNTEYKKIRLGDNFDGGYVISELFLEKSHSLFSYGVGKNVSFDLDFVTKTKKSAFLFDHTISQIPPLVKDMHYFKEGLGINLDFCKDFLDHYKERNISGPVLLKIDIEGGEYPYFDKCDFEKISKIVTGIVIEFHRINFPENQKKLLRILNKLSENFILNHIHGTNFRGMFLYKDEKCEIPDFPKYIECTFVHKNFIKETSPDIQNYPIKDLDFPCSRKAKFDHKINFPDIWNQINKP